MIVKIITVFLLLMAALGMFAKARLNARRRKDPPKLAKTCRQCGRPVIGKGPCPCNDRVTKG